ncbi:MAG: TraB/GumN family protein [Desulfobacterales bacterium]|nr:TraB/GumN family protein [Desulfobacterales bacterium]
MTALNNPNVVHQLTSEGKQITLIGTAHVSKESVTLVKSVIEQEKPETVAVELCPSRFQTIKQNDQWREMDIIKVIKEKKAFLLLANFMLASFQRRIAAKLDIKPGAEMLQAIESGEAAGADIHLADRDIRVTLSRTWRTMGLWAKIKLLFQLILSLGEVEDIGEEDIENMKNQDVLESLLAELGQAMPVVKDILIDERDQYLCEKIRSAPSQKIVAVVGAGHVPGIKKYWERNIQLDQLEVLPPKGRLASALKWLLPGAILILLAAGFYMGGKDAGTGMLTWWVLANGILAGLGALIALGHPLTVVSSVLAAPLTSLNPMIAAGWVSGLVEAFTRKPQVKDFEKLPQDILSVKGFWKNKVTKILLVVVFTNLGSAIGTFVAIPMMLRYF